MMNSVSDLIVRLAIDPSLEVSRSLGVSNPGAARREAYSRCSIGRRHVRHGAGGRPARSLAKSLRG